MIAERRKDRRIDLSGDYYFYPNNKEKKVLCSLMNLSATGACIISSESLEKKAVVFLHIKADKNIILKSEVVWKLENQYGLRFNLDTSDDFENISYIMNNPRVVTNRKSDI
jgi:hypothetical protein